MTLKQFLKWGVALGVISVVAYNMGFSRTESCQEYYENAKRNGTYTTVPAPVLPPPKPLDGPYDTEKIKALLEQYRYPGVTVPIYVEPKLWSTMTQEERLAWQSENRLKFVKDTLRLPTSITPLEIEEDWWLHEVYRNCVDVVQKPYWRLVTCCDGAMKTAVRKEAYWKGWTQEQARAEIKSKMVDGYYPTTTYWKERHTYDCDNVNMHCVYLEEAPASGIAGNIAVVSQKAPLLKKISVAQQRIK